MNQLRVGLIVNPIAGMGGRVGLKGTDGLQRLAEARARGAQPQAAERATAFLQELAEVHAQLSWFSHPYLGGQVLDAAGCAWHLLEFDRTSTSAAASTAAADTQALARRMLEAGVDLLVFVGGDGTARDLLSAIGESLPVLGVPAGVKMHSGVFAVSPRSAGKVVKGLLAGEIMASVPRSVKDFGGVDPAQDGIAVVEFGELRVPEAGSFLQQTKVGGKESEPLAAQDICADVLERELRNRPIVLGAGSTCLAIKEALGFAGTLRGVDVLLPSGDVALDVNERVLLTLEQPRLIVSFTRQQGFLFGRGNQMISAPFLCRMSWPDDVLIVGTRTKVLSLEGRPLLVDTQDVALDHALSGLVEIISGYEDRLLYRIATDYSLEG